MATEAGRLQIQSPYIDRVTIEVRGGDNVVFINNVAERFTVIIENANVKFYTSKDTLFYDITRGLAAVTPQVKPIDTEIIYSIYYHDPDSDNVFNCDAPPRIIVHK